MELVNTIQEIIKEQYRRNGKKVSADLILKNGNILLRAFHILKYNQEEQTITGLTLQEEYFHAKEGRDPIYCTLKLSEIREIQSEELLEEV